MELHSGFIPAFRALKSILQMHLDNSPKDFPKDLRDQVQVLGIIRNSNSKASTSNERHK